MQVTLSREERRLLVRRCSLSQDLLSLLNDDERGARTIALAPSQVEALLTLVADRWQYAGFDEDWDVNDEGRLLEGVIDKLVPRPLARAGASAGSPPGGGDTRSMAVLRH